MKRINLKQELENLRDKIEFNRDLIVLANDFDLHDNGWHLFAINQFVLAYKGAVNSFKHYLKKQELKNQQKIEMTMFALSLCGGSAYTAILGKLSIGQFFGNHALRIICERNMKKTFNKLAMVEGSQVAQFIIGHTVDQAGKWAGKQLRISLAGAMNFGAKMKFDTEGQLQISMENFFLQAERVVRDAFRNLAHSKDSDRDRARTLTQIMNSPFCRAPTSDIWPNLDILSDKIELSFYLKMVLTSGYELFYAPKGGSYAKRINVPPSDSRFPSQHSRKGMYGATVGFDDIGDTIAKRINELYRKPFIVQPGGIKEDLVYDGFWFDGATYNNIKKVEQVLDQLGEQAARNAMQSIRARKATVHA